MLCLYRGRKFPARIGNGHNRPPSQRSCANPRIRSSAIRYDGAPRHRADSGSVADLPLLPKRAQDYNLGSNSTAWPDQAAHEQWALQERTMKMLGTSKGAAGCVIALIVLLFSQIVFAQQAVPSQTLPNQAQVVALARQLEVAVKKGDTASAQDTLDVDGLLDRVMAGVSAPADYAASFRSGAHRDLSLM